VLPVQELDSNGVLRALEPAGVEFIDDTPGCARCV